MTTGLRGLPFVFGIFLFAIVLYAQNLDTFELKKTVPHISDEEIIQLNYGYAWQFYNQNRYDSALEYSNIALSASESIVERDSYFQISKLHSEILYKLDYYSEFIPFQHGLITLLEKKKDTLLLLVAYDRMGRVFYLNNMKDSAYLYYRKSYDIGRNLNDYTALMNSYNNFSTLAGYFGEKDKELLYLKKGLSIAIRNNLEYGKSTFYHNIALAYISYENLDSAFVNVNKALVVNKKTKDQDRIILNKTALGNIYAMRGDLDKAKALFIEILEYHKSSGAIQGQIFDNDNLGFTYFVLGEYTSARKHFFESIRLARTIGDMGEISNGYESLSEIFKAEKNFEKAFTYTKLAQEISDSITRSTNHELIGKIQAEYDFERNKAKITLLSKENELQEKQVKYSRIIIIISLFSLVLLAFLFFILISKLKRNEKLNRQLQMQNISVKETNERLALIENKTIGDLKFANNLQKKFFNDTQKFQGVFSEAYFRSFSRKPVKNAFLWTNKLGNKLYWAVLNIKQERFKGAFSSMYLYNTISKVFFEKEFTDVESFMNLFVKEVFPNSNTDCLGDVQMYFSSFDLKKSELAFVNIGIKMELVRNNKVWDFYPKADVVLKGDKQISSIQRIQIQAQDKLVLFCKNLGRDEQMLSVGKILYKEDETLLPTPADINKFVSKMEKDPSFNEFVFLLLGK